MTDIELDFNQIESISLIVGNDLTGSEITRLLGHINVTDDSGESTKWKRLNSIFSKYKKRFNSSKVVFRFLDEYLSPIRFASNPEHYQDILDRINVILAFSGQEYDDTGHLRKKDKKASTLDDALQRTDSLKEKLQQLGIHERIILYCKEELLEENYFHVVFESAKSLADEARHRTGLTNDGSALFEEAFSLKDPFLMLNNLKTESDRNRQVGLCKMLCGVYSFFRNVEAHEPRIKWAVNEKDAIDALLIISFLHFQLDSCITRKYKD